MAKRYQPKDTYFLKAKASGLRARSAFKLDEIADRLGLIRPGMGVVDLGAAPGGFLQVISRKVGPSGWALGVDLVPISPLGLANVATLQADLRDLATAAVIRGQLNGRGADLVTSDMAPKTSGIRTVDHARSLELCQLALQTALRHLKPSGGFVCKVFMGPDFKAFERELQQAFGRVQVVKPQATREGSMEVYVAATGMKESSRTQ